MKKLALLLFLFFAVAAYAAPPQGTTFFEAEDMTSDGRSWIVKEHFPSWYAGHPSKLRMLAGNSNSPGAASMNIEIKKAGKYYLWLRYLDMNCNRNNNSFTVSVMDGDRKLAERAFDASLKGLRDEPAGIKKWGGGYAQFVWDRLEFESEAAKIKVLVEKTGSGAHLSRHLDCAVVTDDSSYEPKISDFNPIYVKIKMLPEQKTPVAIHLFGLRSAEPWYTPHLNINKKGIFDGPFNGANNMPDEHMKAGDESGWIDISGYITDYGLNKLEFSAIRKYGFAETEASFAVYMSTTPSMDGLLKEAARTGRGNALSCAIDNGKKIIVTDADGSRQSLEYSIAIPEVKGKRPERFPFRTGMSLNPNSVMPASIENELKALANIGINTLSSASVLAYVSDRNLGYNFFSGGNTAIFGLADKCLCSPKKDAMEKQLKQDYGQIEKTGLSSRMVNFTFMDEPGLNMLNLMGCIKCRENFMEYLKANKVDESLLASNSVTTSEKTDIANPERSSIRLSNDPKTGALFYWSNRYRIHVMTEMLRSATKAAFKACSDPKTTVNIATEIIYNGNMVQHGVDWYEIFEGGALLYGQTEDWSNDAKTYQVVGFTSDVMRSACRSRKLPFEMLNILSGRSAWEIAAKGFTTIGSGAKSMTFHNYGPYYTLAADANSNRKDIYEPIKSLTFTIGAVEEHLMNGESARGDAAQLLSITSDIWNSAKDYNTYGKERIYMNLLLRHCGIRSDILAEHQLASELGQYRILFTADPHMRREFVPVLTDWVSKGGVLFLGAGALMYDEYNQPLKLDEELNIRRGTFSMTNDFKRASYEGNALKYLGIADDGKSKVNIVCGIQKMDGGKSLARNGADSVVSMFDCGKGKVIACGFFLGISYIRDAKSVRDGFYSQLDYPATPRDFIGNILAEAGVSARLATDNHLVEAMLTEAPKADVITLANWSGTAQTVKVTLCNPSKYKNVKSVADKVEGVSISSGKLEFKVKVAAGDCIECLK